MLLRLGLISCISISSSKINSNLLASNIFSGIVSFFPPFHFEISGGGKIGSIVILLNLNIKLKIKQIFDYFLNLP